MSQLVREESPVGGGRRRRLIRAHDDVLPEGEGFGTHRRGPGRGFRSAMQSNGRQVVSEARFQIRSAHAVERPAPTVECPQDRGDVARRAWIDDRRRTEGSQTLDHVGEYVSALP
jgi:hypothetical protein